MRCAKFKFDDAEPDEARSQVVAGCGRRSGPGDAEALEHLLRRNPPPTADLDGDAQAAP